MDQVTRKFSNFEYEREKVLLPALTLTAAKDKKLFCPLVPQNFKIKPEKKKKEI